MRSRINGVVGLEGTSYDSLQSLVQQAQQGDTSILPTIRHLLDQVPALWENSHVLAHQVEKAWTNALSGQDLMSKQRLRGHPHPLQGWQYELSALEDEAPLALPPGASLLKPFTFHHHIRHQA